MRITKIGHSSLVVDVGDTRILTDPGQFTDRQKLTDVSNLQALFITHKHSDHVTEEDLRIVLENNNSIDIYTNQQTADTLKKWGFNSVIVSHEDIVTVGDIMVQVWETDHHPIHPEIIPVRNSVFLFNETFLHPGDALFVPEVSVKAVALPFAPFCTIGESINYGTALKPEQIIPVHDGFISPPGPYESIPKMFWEKQGIKFDWVLDGEMVTL